MKRGVQEEGWLICSIRTKRMSHVEVLPIEDVVFATRLLHATHAVVPTATLLLPIVVLLLIVLCPILHG